MRFNLQFFGDEDVADVEVTTGAEEQTVAESEETVNEVNEQTEAEAEEQPVDRNAIFAEARRIAEKNANQRLADRDAEFVRRFGNHKNPITGEPIRSEADYFAALDAQETLRVEQELHSKGVDTQMINNLINNNPAIRQANEMIRVGQQREAKAKLDSDFALVRELDPSIKSLDDIPREAIEYIKVLKNSEHPLVDAFKICTYGKVTSQNAEAIRQGAINQMRGKSHLAPVNGVSVKENGVDIPDGVLKLWRQAYPDLSDSELRKKYNNV